MKTLYDRNPIVQGFFLCYTSCYSSIDYLTRPLLLKFGEIPPMNDNTQTSADDGMSQQTQQQQNNTQSAPVFQVPLTVTSLESVPAMFQSQYEKQPDGTGYKLRSVQGMSNALKSERQLHAEAQKHNKVYQSLLRELTGDATIRVEDLDLEDPDAIKNLTASLKKPKNQLPVEETNVASTPQFQQALQDALNQKEAQHKRAISVTEKSLGTTQSELATIRAAYHRDIMKFAIATALGKEMPTEEGMKLLPHVMQQDLVVLPEADGFKVYVKPTEGSSDFQYRLNQAGAPMTPEEYVSTVLRQQFPGQFTAAAQPPGVSVFNQFRTGQDGTIRISGDKLSDPAEYRKARDAALKQGAKLQIVG